MNDSKVCEDIPNDSTKTTYVKIGAIVIVGAIGILGNAFIIVLALKYTIRKNLTHLIVSMAVADILVAVMGFFFEAAPLLDIKYFFANTNVSILDDILCRTFIFVNHISRLVTLSSLLVISIERFKSNKPDNSSTAPIYDEETAAYSWLLLGASFVVEWLWSICNRSKEQEKKCMQRCH